MNGIFDDFRNAFRKGNNVLAQLILINVLVFVLLLVAKTILTMAGYAVLYEGFSNKLQLPASFNTLMFQPWSFFTNFFVHENIFHILFNMLFLYWFGSLVHEYLGNRRLLNIYLLGGMAGGLAYMLAYNFIPYFQNSTQQVLMMGASGASFAVVIAAATLLPNYTFLLLFIGPVRIKYIALFYLVISIGSSIGANAGGNIAHLGGALLGFLFVVQLRKGRDLGSPISAILDFFNSLFVEEEKVPPPPRKVPQKSYTASNYSSSSYIKDDDYPNEDEVDALLDKISSSGYESLSKEEKLRLFRASQKK